ncbi:hypothetical protein AARAC_009031, partial [Aspergillus arachidicola]
GKKSGWWFWYLHLSVDGVSSNHYWKRSGPGQSRNARFGKEDKKWHGIVGVPHQTHSINYAGYTNGNAQSHGIFIIKILRDLIIGYSKIRVEFVVTRCKGVGISDHELRGFPMGGRY